MTAVTLIAMALSIACISIAWTRLTAAKLVLSLALLFTHISACLYNYNYTLSHLSDSLAYYYDPLGYWNQPWGLGTALVTQLTHILRFGLGATYLDCFLLFQTSSLAGIAILARTFDEIEAKVGVPERRGYWALLFLPSLHFWTVAIGKDGPLLLGITLCVWAMLSFRRRFVYFCVAIVVMVLFRAHIALMAILSLGAAAFFGSSISFGRKVGVVVIAVAGLILVLGPVQSTINADVTSASSVEDFLARQNDIGATTAGTTSVGSLTFPLRLLSLLFRPLFFDAVGVLGVLASAENVLVAIAFLYMLTHLRDLIWLARKVDFVRFIMVFAAIILLSLALIYFNVGLGLRQRVMAYPMIFSLLVALWSVRQRHKLDAAPHSRPRLMVNAEGNRALNEL